MAGVSASLHNPSLYTENNTLETQKLLEAIHYTLYNYNHERIHHALKMPPSRFHTEYLQSVCMKKSA